MIGRLGELLRQLLKDDRSQFVPLLREIETLQLYTRIMEARLEERLAVSIEVGDGAGQALVPQLIFQPLVENAIRHGMDAPFQVRVAVEVQLVTEEKSEGASLRLTVRDHGAGIDSSMPLTMGVGLRNTIQRLQGLYGNEQSFEIRNCPDGGAVVEMRLPLRFSGEREVQGDPALVIGHEGR